MDGKRELQVRGVRLSWKRMRAECGLRGCHHTQLMRYIPGGRPGISVGSAWYCCVDCFALAACTLLESLSSRQVLEIERIPRLSLGLFLTSRGYLSADRFRFAEAQSREYGEGIEDSLLRLGLVSEKQLVAARSAQWGYPMLAPEHIGHWVEADIPQTLLTDFRAVPLHYSATARRILLGFAARVEPRLLESIEKMTDCRVEPCLITPTEYEEQIERVTAPPNYEEVAVEESNSPDRMARTVGRTAVQVGAREAVFLRCKSRVLVRLRGGRGVADVVFRMHNSTAMNLSGEFGLLQGETAMAG